MNRHLKMFLAVAMLGCASHAWAQKPTVLTNAELKSLLSKGLTVRISGVDRNTAGPRSGTVVYQKDGTARYNDSPASPAQIGSWKIDGNKFCTNYTAAGSGCFHVQKTGATTYKLIPLDGLLEGTWEVLKK